MLESHRGWQGPLAAALAMALCLGAGLHVGQPTAGAAPVGDQGDPPRASPELGAFAFPNGSTRRFEQVASRRPTL
jgi:hypothetical protein